MVQEIMQIFMFIFLDSHTNLILLDEPGNNLHPPFRAVLLSLIHSESEKTIVIVTHSVEMISATGLLNTYHLSRKEGKGTKAVRLIDWNQNENEVFFILEPTLRNLLFSTHALLVEGFADNLIVNAIFYLKHNYYIKELEELSMSWAPIRLEGAGRIKGLISLIKKINLPTKFLGDSDVMTKGANFKGSIVESVIQGLAGNNTANDIGKIFNSDKPGAHEECEKYGIFAWVAVDLENMIVETPRACYVLFNGFQKVK